MEAAGCVRGEATALARGGCHSLCLTPTLLQPTRLCQLISALPLFVSVDGGDIQAFKDGQNSLLISCVGIWFYFIAFSRFELK